MDIKSLDLNLLPVLDALLRHDSVSGAARELGMSQPATSYALKRLRALLGDPLFVRTGRGVVPTTRALGLALPLREILARMRDDVLAGGGFHARSAERVFTLCLSDVGSFVLWPRIVQAMRGAAPRAGLRLRTLDPVHIAAALESGEIDLAIGAYPQLPDALFQQRLFAREYVCLVRERHRFTARRPSLRQFAAAEHLVVTAPTRMHQRIDAALAARKIVRKVIMQLPSYLMLPPLIEAGDYVAVVPGPLADAFVGRGRMVSVAVPLTLPPMIVRQHWHRRQHEDAGNLWLRSLVWNLFGADAPAAATAARRAIAQGV